ncbi:hypothetical protein BHU76_14585 [Enterococcus faecalis]|nr:hypothetical protein BHU76_14585 [Enterococcus faecalis]
MPDHFRSTWVKTPIKRKWSGILQAEKAFYTKRRGHATTIYNSTHFPVVFLSISMMFPKFDTLY